MELAALSGLLAAALSAADTVPSLRDTLRGSTVGAVGSVSVRLLAYPAYFMLVNAALAWVIAHRRRAHRLALGTLAMRMRAPAHSGGPGA